MNKEKFKSSIYYISIILLIIKIYYSTSEIFQVPDIVSKMVTLAITGLLALKIIMEKYTIKQALIIGVMIILSGYTSVVVEDNNIFLTVLMIIGIKNVNLKTVLKIHLILNTITIMIHIIAYAVTFSISSNLVDSHFTSYGDLRHSLFLGHPNYSSLIILSTYINYMYLTYYNKKNYFKYILGIALIVFINFSTKSRTTMILLALTIILFFISSLKIKIKDKLRTKTKIRALQKTSKYIFVIFSIATFVFLILYSNFYTPLDVKLDDILSARIWNMKEAMKTSGVTILGQKIDYKANNITLDNLYARTITSFGIIYLAILSYLYITNNSKMKIRDYIIAIIFATCGLTEYLIINTMISVPLIILGDCLFNRGKNGESTKQISKYNSTDL